MLKKIPLTDMRNSQAGKVISIDGGTKTVEKLESIGVRKGSCIVKKSALLGRGPVIVNVSNTEVAIGYKLAKKIMVEVNKP